MQYKDTINTVWICGMWHAPDLLRRQKPPVYDKHSPVTCSRLKLPVQPGLIRLGDKTAPTPCQSNSVSRSSGRPCRGSPHS